MFFYFILLFFLLYSAALSHFSLFSFHFMLFSWKPSYKHSKLLQRNNSSKSKRCVLLRSGKLEIWEPAVVKRNKFTFTKCVYSGGLLISVYILDASIHCFVYKMQKTVTTVFFTALQTSCFVRQSVSVMMKKNRKLFQNKWNDSLIRMMLIDNRLIDFRHSGEHEWCVHWLREVRVFNVLQSVSNTAEGSLIIVSILQSRDLSRSCDSDGFSLCRTWRFKSINWFI